MPLREGYWKTGLPRSHYFFSVSRGDAIRTLTLKPAALWTVAALAALLFGWAASATAYIAFHDRLMRAIVARQAEMEAAYEDRLQEARAELDVVASRQLLDQSSFEGKMHQLLSRQARLEQRSSIVAALATEAASDNPATPAAGRTALNAAPNALGAIEALAPQAPAETPGAGLRAYAPSSAVQIGPSASASGSLDKPVAGDPAPAAHANKPAGEDLGLDAASRLGLVEGSLDRMEARQMTALAVIGRSAARSSERAAGIVAATGLDPAKFVPPLGDGGAGGPYIPAQVDPKAPEFDRALARVERDVALAERLKAIMPFIPLRKPLMGEPSVTSPFGYRADPFLGRLALHTGVDLVQGYGAEIRATGAGRIVHAGPMGGYGTMVEIDHGNGLSTRYAHMSEVLVAEGQEVAQGAVIGRVGTSGRSTGPHLHYEVRVDGEPVDPERFLRAGAQLSSAE